MQCWPQLESASRWYLSPGLGEIDLFCSSTCPPTRLARHHSTLVASEVLSLETPCSITERLGLSAKLESARHRVSQRQCRLRHWGEMCICRGCRAWLLGLGEISGVKYHGSVQIRALQAPGGCWLHVCWVGLRAEGENGSDW